MDKQSQMNITKEGNIVMVYLEYFWVVHTFAQTSAASWVGCKNE